MCAACVAQGVTYVGGAVGALQVMRARAQRRRLARRPAEGTETPAPPAEPRNEPVPADDTRVAAPTG